MHTQSEPGERRKQAGSALSAAVERLAAERWERGRINYRRADQPFVGDPVAEALLEALDGMNYMAEADRQGRRGARKIELLFRLAAEELLRIQTR